MDALTERGILEASLMQALGGELECEVTKKGETKKKKKPTKKKEEGAIDRRGRTHPQATGSPAIERRPVGGDGHRPT